MATHLSILAWIADEHRRLAGCSPWGHKELGTTQQLNHHQHKNMREKRKKVEVFFRCSVLKTFWRFYSCYYQTSDSILFGLRKNVLNLVCLFSMTEDEMVGWHHQLYGHEFEQAPGVGDGQGRLACYSSWDRKELDITERLN